MMASGVQFVTMLGTQMTPTWCVESLVSHRHLERSAGPITVRDPVRYGWMTWDALEVSHTFTIADTVDGENMIAPTARTPVYSALLLFVW